VPGGLSDGGLGAGLGDDGQVAGFGAGGQPHPQPGNTFPGQTSRWVPPEQVVDHQLAERPEIIREAGVSIAASLPPGIGASRKLTGSCHANAACPASPSRQAGKEAA